MLLMSLMRWIDALLFDHLPAKISFADNLYPPQNPERKVKRSLAPTSNVLWS